MHVEPYDMEKVFLYEVCSFCADCAMESYFVIMAPLRNVCVTLNVVVLQTYAGDHTNDKVLSHVGVLIKYKFPK